MCFGPTSYSTPWELLTTYSVPDLPACPPDGCICAVPNGCGEPNMYMLPYKCRVTGATGNAAVAPGTPAVWCEDDPSRCIAGAKQMIYWNQAERNNIEVRGNDLAGDPKSPAYNMKLGFANGAQTDIFQKPGLATQTSPVPSCTFTPKPHHHHSGTSKLSVDIDWPFMALLSAIAIIYLEIFLSALWYNLP
ncbi:hypothetical protein C0995_000657 [Termitomyces sp. Mi166|nr:hypothetical protein C0995_000657 [Termitomyces sp. Mi166\